LLLGKKIEINNLVLLIGGSPPQMLALNSSDFIPQFKLDDLVDIGCGMAAVKMPFTGDRLDGKLKKIRHQIERSIPVGRWGNKNIDKNVTNWQGWQDFKELHPGVQDLDNKAVQQMGSLGGGNHFIELCLDTENYVWLMLHSGSRHIGNKLAECHISTGKKLAQLANISLPDPDLAYFVAGTPEFAAYWRDLQWAQDYARFNRDVMMGRFKKVVEEFVTGGKEIKPLLSVNCHHNYAEKEVHFDEEVYVTRKGAVRAQESDYGIIPGSMGTKSYIVKGKGNHDSYCSCSHGAGRLMSRTKAKQQITVEDVIEQTQGVECRKDLKIIDEIPGAYKPIEEVMAQQSDLVEVVATLKQVVCVKG
jgi:tRNA-splicing ligase RtcB